MDFTDIIAEPEREEPEYYEQYRAAYEQEYFCNLARAWMCMNITPTLSKKMNKSGSEPTPYSLARA